MGYVSVNKIRTLAHLFRKLHLKHVLCNKERRELSTLPKMQRRFNEKVIDWAGGKLVISPCGWITWGRKEENELWSINLFIHDYPLSLSQSASLSLSQFCVTHGLMAPNWPALPGGALCQPIAWLYFFHNTSLSPQRGLKKHLDDITDIRFQRSHRSPCEERAAEVGEERATRLIRIFLYQSDDLCCRVNILGS